MLLYSSVGTSNLPKALDFYDKILAPLGGKRGDIATDRFFTYTSGKDGLFAVCTPFDEQAPQPGNGTTIAFTCGDRDTVDAVYKAAMDNGASDEGAPGVRFEGLYGAYFRDPDGNKLAAIHLY